MPDDMGIGDETPRPLQTGSPNLRTEDVLQSITWGANKSGKATLAIKSAHFGTYLRMDGWGPKDPAKGGGIVNSQTFIGIFELFRLVPQEDGSVGIQSVHCGNYLRMDGENVTDNGGGAVNCQSFVGFMEKFIIQPVEGGAVAIKSASYNTYLRMDAIGTATLPIVTGGGSVNCSREIRSWERFYIEAIKPVVALKSVACKLYLRVDCCISITEGRVCGQNYLGAWEKFILERTEDGAVSLKSEAFKSYLHIQDAQGTVTVSEGPMSQFLIHFQPEGYVAFESVTYRDMYLHMAANGVVSCKPPPICNNHCFFIVVDT